MTAFPFPSIISAVLCSALVVAPVWSQTPLPVHENIGAEPDSLQIHILNKEKMQADIRPGAKQNLTVQVTDSTGAAVPNVAVTCRLPDNGPTGVFGDGTHAAVAYSDAQGRATLQSIQWGEVSGPVAIRLTATKGTAHNGILVQTNLTAAGPGQSAVQVTAPAPIVSQPAPSQPAVSVTKPAPQPGQLATQSAAITPGPNKLTPEPTDQAVTVSRTSAADAPHSSHAKWYILAGVAVAAGAGAAFAMKGKGTGSTSSNNTSLSIGNPSISVGHP